MSRFVGGRAPAGYSGSGPIKPPGRGGGGDKPVRNTTPTRGSQPGKPAPTKPTRGCGNKGRGGPSSGPGKGIK